jgi:hypothetical protein
MPLDPVATPDAIFIRRRWVPTHRAKYGKECAEILREHGAVNSVNTYEKRHQARWRAQYLINLLVRLEHFQRWELAEHTNRVGDEWGWTVEYLAKRRESA